MNLIRERNEDYLVVKVCVDRFIGSNSIELKDFIISLVKEGENRFVIDLSLVDFMDFSGIAGLLPISRFLPTDSFFLFAGLSPKVTKLFKLTKLDEFFEILPSVEDALRYEKSAIASPS
ncbi:STAS domain-containing protein [Maridesulfovibrio zosterae]|uniref:STAS domain-containing protein n=1 Tax=Maridesulfovibrio zosterae TaxID=82171 RepID=UPI0004252733|nr:STAS domain-containing protein [Maridesulfovibrio zosterae]